MISSRQKVSSSFFLTLVLLFAFIFPKGGIKPAGIPITWGYLLIALSGLLYFLRSFYKVHPFSLLTVVALIPFQIIALSTMAINGIEDKGFAFSFIFSFFLLPWIFFLVLDEKIEKIPKEFLFSFIRKGIYFLAFYGIFLFIWKIVTGKFIEIPMITINLGDWGEIQNKYINRGRVFKLISTYNNGNIFGICILMLMPLFNLLEKSLWRKAIVKSALILTLSRTVWIGFFFSEFLYLLFLEKNMHKKVGYLVGMLGFTLVFGIFLNLAFGFNASFLFDLSLGGRIGLIKWAINESNYFSNLPFFAIGEVIYASIALIFGFFGLLFFVVAMISPLVAALLFSFTEERKAIFLGLITYLLICCSDGAILYIPVMAFYWFLASLLWKDLSSSEKALLPAGKLLSSQ